jgi:hypothetical protein
MFRCQDLARHRAAAPRLIGRRLPAWARRAAVASSLVAGTLSAIGTLPQPAVALTVPQAPTFTKLTLMNGWHGTLGYATPAVANISGIVTFKGDISTTGANPVAFILPKGFRPATNVYVISPLCGANKGRLFIQPNGVVMVMAEDNFAKAQCVTGLDGVSFAKSATLFTKLQLQNGWKNAPFSTSNAAVRLISGIVHFKGAIYTNGTKQLAFTLPKGFRPAAPVFIPVDLCNANKGRLQIEPSGVVFVWAELNFSDAACFTSLDGATFAISARSFTTLKLQNGWQYYGYSTYKPAVRLSSGIVQFEGAIYAGANPFTTVLFTLPKSMRPAKSVYIEIDLCRQNNGRLYIQPTGAVQMYAENGVAHNPQCFTSLDGAWFAR